MIITRKIQIYVSEQDTELKKKFISTLYDWRFLIRKAANTVVAHKFCQDQIRDFIYLKDEIKDKFYIKDTLKEEKGMSEQNTTYRVLSDMLKGKVPSDIYACLNQAIANTYKETKSEVLSGKASLRSYKNNIPLPFSAKALSNIHWASEDKRFYFTLFGLPFACALGADRSNNKVIIERCISGEYKICSSSIAIDDHKKKIFLYLCIDIPKKQIELKQNKTTYAFLSASAPVVYINANSDWDVNLTDKAYEIGNKEEFLHGRLQIQAALRRLQMAAKYNKGGKGRKRKTQCIDRFHEKEKNYIGTKLHTYSKLLVEAAKKAESSKIVLVNQETRQKEANADELLLRNWSYYGLIEKIKYKAELHNISVESINI